MAFRRKQKRKDESSRNSRAVRVMGGFVFICLIFAAGFVLRGNDVLLERLGMDSLSIEVEQNPGATVSGDTFDSISARVAEVQGIIEQNSLNGYGLDEATRSLIEDLLKETGDPYVRYYDPQSYAAYAAKEADAVYGVGILFGDYQNQAYALDVIPGSSAQAADVREGDFVVAIDGERKSGGWPLPDAIKAIERVAKTALPRGYGYEYSGTTIEEIKTTKDRTWLMLLIIVFTYLVLAALFESPLIPMAVLLSVPFGLMGCYLFALLFQF